MRILLVMPLSMLLFYAASAQPQDRHLSETQLVLVTEVTFSNPLLIEIRLSGEQIRPFLRFNRSELGVEMQSETLTASFLGPNIRFSYTEQMGAVEFKIQSSDPGIRTIVVKGDGVNNEGQPIITNTISFKGSVVRGSFLTQIVSPNHLLITQR